jgi:hypothetical protein
LLRVFDAGGIATFRALGVPAAMKPDSGGQKLILQ